MGPRPGESEDDYRARKRKEKESETPEQRAARKAKEAERDKRDKEKEKDKRPKETEEERAARKAKEAERDKRDKDKRPKETEEERAARKAKEAERDKRDKEKEKDKRPKETEEERAARKAKERQREDDKSKKEVVHKQLHHVPTKESESDKPATTSSSSRKAEPKVQVRPDRVEEEDDDYDDDDFEDGFGEDEIEKVRKALEEENARLLKDAQAKKRKEDEAAAARKKKEESSFGGDKKKSRRSKKDDSSDDDDDSDDDEGGATSKFGAGDLQRQKYRAQFDKDLERALALRRLIDLESVSVTIADIAPMSEYDRYIRSFGGAGRTQASVQAPPVEDIVSTEVQADRVHLKSKGSQCPSDLGLFPERLMQLQEQRRMEAAAAAKPGVASAAATTTSTASGEDAAAGGGSAVTSSSSLGRKSVDTAALSSFLSRVFPVVRSILDENDQLHNGGVSKNVAGSSNGVSSSPEAAGAPFSSSLSTLGCKLVEGRSVMEVSISPAAPQFVTALYGEHQRADAPLSKYPSIVLVWNTNDPRTPDRILVCTSALTTITTSPIRQHIVYAGTASGSVCVWDLREPNYRHKTIALSLVVEGGLETDKIAIRSPSFTSVWNPSDNHENPVRQVCVVGHNAVAGAGGSKRDEGEQLISVDSKGTIFYWLVSGGAAAHDDGQRAGEGSGASPRRGLDGRIGEADHGSNFHSSVRLFKSATVNALPSNRRGDIVSCVEFFPSDPSQLAIGASQVLHINRFGSLTAPSSYTHHSLYSQVSSVPPVTSLSFGPLDSRVLLASYEDGTLRLFLREEAEPKLIITASTSPLTRVRASPTSKWITFALDGQGTFYVFDHAAGVKTSPVHKSVIKSTSGKCTVFDVAQDSRGTDAKIVMGFEGGQLQVHTVPSDGVKAQGPRNDMWL